MQALAVPQPSVPAQPTVHPQPNELDRKRIARALAARKRYRYVSPRVRVVESGYIIESPCCSRKVDPSGGCIDVALLQYAPGENPWRLYRKLHDLGRWHLHGTFNGLFALLQEVNTDPLRLFWQ
ncbi:MAG: DUF3024 domain-containing protein [Steroidobacteraceae bacterium]